MVCEVDESVNASGCRKIGREILSESINTVDGVNEFRFPDCGRFVMNELDSVTSACETWEREEALRQRAALVFFQHDLGRAAVYEMQMCFRTREAHTVLCDFEKEGWHKAICSLSLS